ncbi:MAG: hypothetical protein HKN57_04435 [Xanthomonadales bacterium]|nr:hypothetical protein [Gammaproteobacteria bacterium]MBT8054358.1 hypothetical protein [Gammaproteobacteria bacterium]NND56478.1 hypothetical protein [Xanthomonadales bacterium]NNK51173.1 hypothetical protein [Xanthomonadales bacterium]
MIQSFLMFLAPAQAPQARPISPPAVVRPAEPLTRRGVKRNRGSLRFGASVLANTVGCGAMFAACWFSVQLMQLLMLG